MNSLDLSAAGIGLNAGINAVNAHSNSVLASVYLDIPTNSRWAPYVGGGLGYQAKVGLNYLANKKTDIFVEGVYQGSSGFEENSIDYSSVNMWGARLGARFRF